MVYQLDRRELTSLPYLDRLVIGNRSRRRRLVFGSASLTLESSAVLRLPLEMEIEPMIFRYRCQEKKRSTAKQLLERHVFEEARAWNASRIKGEPMPVVTIETSGAVRSSNRALKRCNHLRTLE